MAEDINKVFIIGRLTRDAELQYTNSGSPVLKFSIAVNRRRKQGEQWVDEANFFDVNLWGRRAESISQYMTKGKQIAVDGELRQDRWEQDGQKRSKVMIHALNIQFVGGRSDGYSPAGGEAPRGSQNQQGRPFETYSPPAGGNGGGQFEDDIPF